MIVLDTQAWVWLTQESEKLSARQLEAISLNKDGRIGVSAISCWEIAKLFEYGRIELSAHLSQWFDLAFGYPGVELLPLTPEVAIESTALPGDFHRDPADQIIVATARLNGCALVTSDREIAKYLYVETIT